MKAFQSLFTMLAMWLCAIVAVAGENDGRIKVLVVTGGHDFAKEPFFKMFTENADIVITAAAHAGTNATAYAREDFLSYDVVVFYDMMRNITDRQKAQFKALTEKGVGLLVLHHALVAYADWPDYERIIGGRYTEP